MVVNSIKLLFKDLIGWRNSVNKSDFKGKISQNFSKEILEVYKTPSFLKRINFIIIPI